MTLEQYTRAQLANFALQQVGGTASVNCLKAICLVMLNRQRAGWSNDLLELMAQADAAAAHDPRPVPVTSASSTLQGLLRDIDDIFFGTGDDETRKIVSPPPPRKPLLYWQNLLVKETRPWFVDQIVRSPDHPRKAQVGMIVFYE
jgi:hypothetical protein